MWEGKVLSLHSCAEKSQPLITADQLVCLAGIGIEGARYTLGQGTYSGRPEEGRQITFFETETLEALQRDFNINLLPEQTRRNVITQGVPLNHLVGCKFKVGNEVVVEAERLSVPCQYLEDLLNIKSLFKALINRSGLNCKIIEGGVIRPDDSIIPLYD